MHITGPCTHLPPLEKPRYVNAEVNGHKFKAFVDSGAQMSIMTLACAERCNLSRLIDRRYQGVARGVGQSKIVGRIHQVRVVESEWMLLERVTERCSIHATCAKHHHAHPQCMPSPLGTPQGGGSISSTGCICAGAKGGPSVYHWP